ncbi:MAG TPA: hypothetical protein VFV10_17090 [Gammaproteobacteria bacterium]|nr:hypothetical protein [Gammaproteobacteria bacterium]
MKHADSIPGRRGRAVLDVVLASAVVAAAAAAAGLAPSAAQAQPPACDRACLEDLAGRYMAALVAHEPGKLPWAERVRFTENEVPLMIGDGAWGTVTKISSSPYVAADPVEGNVLWFGVVEEHGQPAYFAVRLGIEGGGKIAEVESVVGREGTPAPFAKTDGYALDASFSARAPAGGRVPRERLVALADGYYNTMQLNDGQLFTAFDADCRRITNGVVAPEGVAAPSAGAETGGAGDSPSQSCSAQFENGLYKPVDRVRARRFPVVDEERGVVVAIAFLDHAARYVDYRTLDGASRKIPVEYPNSHVVLELIKLEDGKVHRIEGVAAFLPYLMPTIWLH